jgi:hypothetical protein
MKPFVFAQLLSLQLADERLRREQLKTEPDPCRVVLLDRRKNRIAARLRKSVAPLTLAEY